VRPIGATEPSPADIRVICASARDLVDEVQAGRFREDLYHRLNVVRIEIPPLRSRKEDIPALCSYLLYRADARARLHSDVLPILAQHPWPGNVRELDNTLRAAAALADGSEITPELVAGLLSRRTPRPREGLLDLTDAMPSGRGAEVLKALGSGWHSAPDLAGRFGVSVRTVNRDLEDLLRRNLAIAIGEARARRYTSKRRVPSHR
jgi:two-component system response regulator PilR (NtrC family)